MLNTIGSKPIFARSTDYLDKVIDKLKSSQEVIERIKVNNLNLQDFFDDIRKVAQQLLHSIDEKRRIGRNPYALAVSSVYAASIIVSNKYDLQVSVITQRLLSRITEVAEFTIREHLHTLFKIDMAKAL